MKIAIWSILLGCCVLSSTALAAEADLEDFIKGEWCTAPDANMRSEIPVESLYKELLAANPVSNEARDLNSDLDTTYDETVNAINDLNRCGPKDLPNRPACRKGDRASLNLMFNLLDYIRAASGETIETPTHLLTIRQLSLQPGDNPTDPALVLRRNPRRYAIGCVKKSSATLQAPSKPPRVVVGAVVRGKVGDLTPVLSKENAGKISAASVAYKNDAHGNADSFSIDGVAGFVFSGKAISENLISALSPYVRVERKRITKEEKKTTDIDNIGLGVLVGKYLVFTDMVLDVTARPELVTSSDFDSLVFYSEVGIGITPNLPCFGANYRLGAFDLFCQLRAVGDIGIVMNDAGKPALVAIDDYGRVGIDLSVSISGNDESFFDPLQLSLAYKDLRDLSGGVRNDLRRFEGAIAYTFADKLESGRFLGWEVSVKYVNGEADVTLQDQEFTQLSLGVKY